MVSPPPQQRRKTMITPWSRLDDATVESILARLPTVDIIRSQLVCKRWKSIIFGSPTFTFTYLSKEYFDRTPWFAIVEKPGSFMVYDTEVSKLRCISQNHSDSSTLVAASAGLMCFRHEKENLFRLIVANPLSGLSRVLPELDVDITQFQVIGIAMHASSPNSFPEHMHADYKVYVSFGYEASDLALKVFSSEEETWMDILKLEPLKKRHTKAQLDSFRRNKIYVSCMATLGSEGQIIVNYFDNYIKERLICVDTSKRTRLVKDISVGSSFFDGGVDNMKIICSGKVLAISAAADLFDDGYKLSIFELDTECYKLKPNPITVKNCGDGYLNVSCASHGDCVMVCLRTRKTGSISGATEVWMYNLESGKWTYLLEYPTDGRLTSALAFFPDIQARV